MIEPKNGILPTHLGQAAFASSISPEESAKIFDDLEQARRLGIVLDSDLHLLHLITPHFKGLREPKWAAMVKIFRGLTKTEQQVAEFYGINKDYMEWAL